MKNSRNVIIAGLPVTPFTSIKEFVDRVCPNGRITPGFAIALNAEKLASSLSDPKLYNLLRSSSVLYADGIPIVWLIKKLGFYNVRIPGCELWGELMNKAGEHNLKVFILGGDEIVNQKTADKLRNEFNVNNLVHMSGYYSDESKVLDLLNLEKPDVVTVAMGSPLQEQLICRLREVHPDAFYMGVGGTYDVFVGKVKRAPKIFINLNLEWLYRLLKQPLRFKRQLKLFRFILFYFSISKIK